MTGSEVGTCSCRLETSKALAAKAGSGLSYASAAINLSASAGVRSRHGVRSHCDPERRRAQVLHEPGQPGTGVVARARLVPLTLAGDVQREQPRHGFTALFCEKSSYSKLDLEAAER